MHSPGLSPQKEPDGEVRAEMWRKYDCTTCCTTESVTSSSSTTRAPPSLCGTSDLSPSRMLDVEEDGCGTSCMARNEVRKLLAMLHRVREAWAKDRARAHAAEQKLEDQRWAVWPADAQLALEKSKELLAESENQCDVLKAQVLALRLRATEMESKNEELVAFRSNVFEEELREKDAELFKLRVEYSKLLIEQGVSDESARHWRERAAEAEREREELRETVEAKLDALCDRPGFFHRPPKSCESVDSGIDTLEGHQKKGDEELGYFTRDRCDDIEEERTSSSKERRRDCRSDPCGSSANLSDSGGRTGDADLFSAQRRRSGTRKKRKSESAFNTQGDDSPHTSVHESDCNGTLRGRGNDFRIETRSRARNARVEAKLNS